MIIRRMSVSDHAAILWHCRILGRCICCGVRAPRTGPAFGICDTCLHIPRDLKTAQPAVVEEWLT